MQPSKIYQNTNLIYQKRKPARRKKKILLWVFLVLLFVFFSLFFIKAGFTVHQIIISNDPIEEEILKKELPLDDPNQLNILLMGMRGSADDGEGKFLADAIVLLSIKKSTGQIALISLPRDLYVDIYCLNEMHRINFAYAQGGMDCIKKTVSWLTGLYVDYGVVSNFKAFSEVIDALGGITIYMEQSFEESFQWAKEGWSEDEHWTIKEINGEEKWVFQVATGTSHLDGATTLYFVRSRFSSSDFDRMRRQQKVLLAIKEKALSLGVLTNPVKVYKLLDIAGKNVRTDMSVGEIISLMDLAAELDTTNIKKLMFDSGPDGLLYETFVENEYVLLPLGDNWDMIRQASQNIFN